jgi:hypothetical protein
VEREEIVLTRPDRPRATFCRLTLDGARVSRATWAGDGKPRQSSRDIEGPPGAARNAYIKEVRKKMNEGFVFLRPEADAAPGRLVLECLAPNRHASDAFDLRPDGAELAVGTALKNGYGAEIHVIDVATGERRLVHAEPVGPRQTFVHAVRYDADGTALVYALNGQTRRLDLETGATRVLAAYEQWKSASFNPFCVRPEWDAARRRLLVFDAGDLVRVLDADGSLLLEVCTEAGTTECRAGALSPSGRLLALYRPSRGVVYHHQDALHDTTNEIEVWDVAARRRTARIPVPAALRERSLDKIGFDPTETLIVTNPGPVQGPCALSIDTGEPAWHFPDAHRTDRWDTCFAWAYAPSGGPLAIGRWHDGAVDLRDPATHEPWPGQLERPERHRVKRIAFSRDGRLMAAGGDSGTLTLRKIAT